MLVVSFLNVLIVLLARVSNGQEFDAAILDEQAIITGLLKNYQTYIRPNDQVNVKATFKLRQIIGLDEKHEIMTTNFDLYVSKIT
jgi:hypothetical protein